MIRIYQDYLNRFNKSENAETNIAEFLDEPDLDDVVLNTGYSQRLMFVAANFRKEVTSTALWLLGQGLSLQCMKVTAYCHDNELYLNVEQIIPTPEAEELMVSMSVKAKEEKVTVENQNSATRLRFEFWEQTIDAFIKSDCRLFDNRSSCRDRWLSAGSGVSNCPFTLIFGKVEARVELNVERPSKKENKMIFDTLFSQRAELEAKFGDKLYWQRLDDKKASRVRFHKPFEGFQKENWPEMIKWLIENMIRFEKTFKQPLLEAAEQMKKTVQEPVNTV